MSTLLSIPCCIKGLCPDPANPFENLSAESPDAEIFLAFYSGNPQQPPPLGWTWGSLGCKSLCTSTVSQQDADLCAQRQQVQCTTQNCQDQTCQQGGGGGWNPPGEVGINPTIFTNTDQACTVNCPDGLPFTYTFPAGSISGINQDYLNEQAQSLACIQATLVAMCLENIPNTAMVGTPYSANVVVSGGTPPYNFTIIGGLPPGLTFTSSGTAFLTISGTPTQAGPFSFTVACTDSTGLFMNKTYTITVAANCTCTTPPGINWQTSTGLGTCRLRIHGYVDGVIPSCAGSTPTGAPNWDGTFPVIQILFAEVYKSVDPVSIQGKGIVANGITLSFGAGTWTLGITDNAFNNLWTGTLVSACPIGTYSNQGVGCNPVSPATITLEAYTP